MAGDEWIRVASVSALVLAAGCTGGLSGLLGGGSSLSFSAAEISVSESAVSQTGFSVVSNENVSFERSFEVRDQSRAVKMNADMIHLQRSSQAAPSGTVVILSLPEVEMLGQQIPVTERVSPVSLVDQARSSSDGLQRQQKIGERTVSILGEERTVEVFRGTANRDGESAGVKIYVTTFEYRSGTIAGVGIVPRGISGDGDAPLTIFETIQRE